MIQLNRFFAEMIKRILKIIRCILFLVFQRISFVLTKLLDSDFKY